MKEEKLWLIQVANMDITYLSVRLSSRWGWMEMIAIQPATSLTNIMSQGWQSAQYFGQIRILAKNRPKNCQLKRWFGFFFLLEEFGLLTADTCNIKVFL